MKALKIVVSLAIIFSLTACGGSTASSSSINGINTPSKVVVVKT